MLLFDHWQDRWPSWLIKDHGTILSYCQTSLNFWQNPRSTSNFLAYLTHLHFRFCRASMKVFTVCLVFLMVPVVDGLVCLGRTRNFDFSVNNANQIGLKEKLQSLTFNSDRPDQTHACHVTVLIPAPRTRWIFEFNALMHSELASQNGIRFETNILHAYQGVGKLQHSSAVLYICSKHDGCDKAFLLNYLDWMIRMNMDLFASRIAGFLLNAGKGAGKSIVLTDRGLILSPSSMIEWQFREVLRNGWYGQEM